MSENPTTPAPSARHSSCLVKGLVVLTLLALVCGGLWWWHNRPIRPVELSAKEQAVVKAKMTAVQQPAEPTYDKGSKEIIFTERELNGLLNQNTTLGQSLSFELARNAVHARVETDIDPDLPIVGGKHLKARARFLVGKLPGQPAFVLDDVTVWGVSLPNDWLGGIKGRNLLEEVLGGKGRGIAGMEEFRVEPGRLIIRLAE
ncbi:MAG: hypothetical protein NTV46_19235 [Verrucomicrobia bacterium]|nr:hypothetical protein [Verrucomicrobiota bacterium]